MEETEKTVSRAIRFTESAWDEISQLAKSEGMIPAAYVRAACNEKIERDGIEDRLTAMEQRLEELKTDLKPIFAMLFSLKKDNEKIKSWVGGIWHRVHKNIVGRIF